MKFALVDAAGTRDEFVEINTIEELVNLANREDHPIIFYSTDRADRYPVLEIYNDYIE